MDNVTVYNILRGVSSYELSAIIRYVPRPAKSDYIRGFLMRRFAKKINTGEVLEIDPATRQNPFYVFKQIKWTLTGNKNTEYKNGYSVLGVYEKNENAINELKTAGFTDVNQILKDPLQFWRGY